MRVGMSNCGPLGWVSDALGYRYQGNDPLNQQPWPDMPRVLRDFAQDAAQSAGYADFHPDACLINCYAPGAGLTLHQDRDETMMCEPIVSVSLGLPAIFVFGGLTRTAPIRQWRLGHGDVLVWGGPSRLCYHGVQPVAPGVHPLTGRYRFNLTFRRAGYATKSLSPENPCTPS